MDERERAIEAMVFASESPLSLEDIVEQLDGLVADRDTAQGGAVAKAHVAQQLAAIATRHAGSGIELVERGGHWHFQTARDLAGLLRRPREEPRKLSQAASETLAIIAYHEPVTRADIQEIRGVQPGKDTLAMLMEVGWVALAGRRAVPGRPLLYKTTPQFLSHFGLSSREDLPGLDDLRESGLLEPRETDLLGASRMDEANRD